MNDPMTENNLNQFIIRCRAVIMHDGKLLVVRHMLNDDYLALPGGHLEWGESIQGCMRREIIEELGVEPKLGRLLYVNNFVQDNVQSLEFFFEITNGGDYVDCEKLERTHAHELAEILWMSPSSNVRILPDRFGKDFAAGTILSDTTKVIDG